MEPLIDGLTQEQQRLVNAYHATADDHHAYVSASEVLRDVAVRQLRWSEEFFEAELQEITSQVGPPESYSPNSLGFYYRALLALTQPWRCRYPIFEAKGMPIGELHDDDPSGPDFVEISLSKCAHILMPRGRPPLLPISLLIGSVTAQGPNIPPHNLYELWMAQEQVRQDPASSLEDLMETLPGPDFPTGAIAGDPAAIRTLYETGRAELRVRAIIDEEIQGGRTRVAVTSLPPGLLIRTALESISNLSRIGRLKLFNIQNASKGGQVRIVVDAPKELSATTLKEVLFREGELERRIPYQILPEKSTDFPRGSCVLASILAYTSSKCSPAWERKDGEKLDRVPTLKEVMEFGGYKSPLSEWTDSRRTRILEIG